MKYWIGLAMLFFSSLVIAQDQIYTGIFSNKALDGYDAVAYFTENKPVKGLSQFKTEYKGAQWFFSSQQNLDSFVADPEKYAPQFGGYCAWAVSEKNDFAPGDPQYWAVEDGKLYLNYDKKIKGLWDKDRAHHIEQANKNWPTLIGKE
ncbi:YHS domain-containing protein [Vibrio metoecus]|uniref:YHS domain-containing (seleno)protein n=1 Tax=Vibrio metoecus TaxID=1481663 RepID=UPI0006D7EC13|nr:YHS domain-containing (seleno)protein [Vibrio metoecus]KQB06430.1 YHS domain protein [Vibrio metoecus]PAR49072.1 YHS domain-containing protein [Vibrio metoecus]